MSISEVSTATATGTQGNSLGVQDFLKILLTQLTYQDPLKPMDNQQFLAQMAQFTSLEQTQRLNTNMETLVGNQSALQSVGLIGKTVDVTSNGQTYTGTVSALSLAGTSPAISITKTDGTTLTGISISQISAVR